MIEQGTPEWHQLRCGKVTASRVADIVRKVKSGGISASRQRYLGELVAERLTGVPNLGFKSADMEWGNATEDQACARYAFTRDVTPVAIDFVDHPSIALSGASPDRLINDDGLVEIKCPAIHTHLDILMGGAIEPDYVKQIQWQLACTERAWCDYVSFNPLLPTHLQLFVRRVEHDEIAIREIETAVQAFLADVATAIEALNRLEDAA